MFKRNLKTRYSYTEYIELKKEILELLQKAEINVKHGHNSYAELLRIRDELLYMI